MLKLNNSLNNSAKNTNKITISKWQGIVNSNVLAQPEYPPSVPPAGCEIKLDFSCGDNSQYIPLI